MLSLEKVFYIIISTILVTVFILFTFVFSPNAVDNQKGKVKTIYFADNISKAHQKIIDKFNKKYEGQIKVETINLPFEKFSTNERKELLARYLRSKSNRIDVFSVDIIWVPRFAKWSLPLDSMIDSQKVNNLLPYALKSCLYDNKLYALPLYIDIALMFYRDDMLKQLPDYQEFSTELASSITWERFFELKKKLKTSDKNFYIFQADDYEGLLCSFTEIMSNLNSRIIQENEQLKLDEQNTRKAISFLHDLIYSKRLSPQAVTDLRENNSYQFFVNNNSFAVRGWPNFLSDDNHYLSKNLKSNIKRAPLPHLEGSEPASVFGGWNLMVSKYSERIPEVMKFLEFILSDEAQKILYEEENFLPVIKSLYQDLSFTKNHSELKYYDNLFRTGVYRPFLEEYTNVSDILSFYINKALKNEISIDEAVKLASEKISEKIVID
ncbi:MAG: extracellular solute-binding protein [Ignavibacterium sp.]|jgi:multiple sugar transport system substrate-binding protein|uniref:extracellular solute-binding protein n=1 Tax=Ignavibacterium sp. TaxID=2651167 RepID=UPI00329A6F03